MSKVVLEATVEATLKRLEGYGFEVIKLVTPGYTGVMDRMILMPTWSPGPPAFLELKRPGKDLRPLQGAVANDWRARGCDVLPMCDTKYKVEALVIKQVKAAVRRYVGSGGELSDLPPHILNVMPDSEFHL